MKSNFQITSIYITLNTRESNSNFIGTLGYREYLKAYMPQSNNKTELS